MLRWVCQCVSYIRRPKMSIAGCCVHESVSTWKLQVDSAARLESVLWAHTKPQATVCCDRLCTRQPLSLLSCGTLFHTVSAGPKPEPVASEAAERVYNLHNLPLAVLIEFLVRQACHHKARVGAPLNILLYSSALRQMTGKNYGWTKKRGRREQEGKHRMKEVSQI